MAVYTRIPKTEAARIAKRFRLGTVERFEGIAKGSVNTNYRLVTDRGTFFVRLDEKRTSREVAAEQTLIAFLAKNGFPTPEPLADSRGKRLAEYRKKPLAVFPWLPGADKEAHEYSLRDLSEAGRMLAKLHDASKGFPHRLPNRFGLIATAARWSRIRGKARIPAAHRDEIDAAVAALSERPAPSGPAGVVHGDWFCDNLLFQGARITGVLDFEAAATDALAFDVATAINALCWLPSDPERVRAPRVKALLEGYRDARGPAFRGERQRAPLVDESLLFWLRASALRFTVTRILDFRLRTSSLRVEKDYRDFLKRHRWWARATSA